MKNKIAKTRANQFFHIFPSPLSLGGMVAVWVVSVCPVALLVYAAYASWPEQVAHMPALLFGLLVAAGGPVCYLLSRRWWGKPLPTPQPTEIAAD